MYLTKRGLGIHRNVAAWRTKRERDAFSLDTLIADIDAVGVSAWASSFGNSQVSPGRREDAPCGPTKAAAVREAAGKLREAGINLADDIEPDTAKTTLRAVSGIGFATSNYFLMLLGVPGVKPDRMIHRFLKEAAGHAFSNTQAVEVLHAVAAHFGVREHKLDHAIWRYESQRASQ